MLFKKQILLLALFIGFSAGFAQDTSHILKVIFRYGSIPAPGHEEREYREVGGLFGGHVSLGLDSLEIGFSNKRRVHTFQKSDNPTGYYYWEYLKYYEDSLVSKKSATIEIPLTHEKYNKLREILVGYIENTPYDYAFFGIRCASATYEVLGQIGIVEPLSYNRNIIRNFYPRLFRRKMLRLARKNNYTIIRQNGRGTRIWEGG